MSTHIRAIRFAIAGGVAALIGSLIALPWFVGHFLTIERDVFESPEFRFYEYFSRATMAASVASAIALMLGLQRVRANRAWMGAGLAALYAVVLSVAMTALLLLSLFGSSHRRPGAGEMVFELASDLSISFVIAVAVGLAAQPNRERVKRALLAGFCGMIGAHVLRRIVTPLVMMIFIGSVIQMATSRHSTNMHGEAEIPLVLATSIGIGAALGFAFGLMDALRRVAWLQVPCGANESRSVAVEAGDRIGTHPSIEVVLPPNPTVSKVHARFETGNEALRIVDVGSPAGVVVNGSKVASADLHDGDRIQLGATEVVYRAKDVAQTPYSIMPAYKAPVGRHWLVDDFGVQIDLVQGDTVVGRDSTAQLALNYDASISRRHASILCEPARVVVTDLGSRNGTFVNGARIMVPAPLRSGDRVRFGGTTFEFRSDVPSLAPTQQPMRV